MIPIIKRITRDVCSDFGVPLDEVLGRSREQRLALPRQVAMYLSYDLTGFSLTQVARNFERDHTTVVHAKRKVADLIVRDPAFHGKVDRIIRKITGDED